MIRLSFAFLFFQLSIAVFAQKIKYKEVYPQLYPKQTTEGISLLKQYLADEKNQDEPNANYQLGEFYYSKYLTINVLSDTAALFAYSDSASSFLNLAIELIDEKELKKNDAYYQSFYRRDLRTGEFGIKISDVHLDIEKKIESIRNRNIQVVNLHATLESMGQTHRSMVKSFNSVVASGKSYSAFLFQLNDEVRTRLTTLVDYQYQMTEKSKAINELYGSIGQPNPFNELSLSSIDEFQSIQEIFNPYQNEFVSWNMEQWAEHVNQTFRKEVESYKEGLLRWDQALHLANQRITEGNTANIQTDVTADLLELHQKYAPEGSMRDYLKLKSGFLMVQMMIDTALTPQWLDSTMVAQNVMMSDSIVSIIARNLALVPGLGSKLRTDAQYYQDHIDQLYGGVSAMSKSVGDWEKTLSNWSTLWTSHQAFWNDKNTWVVWDEIRICIDSLVSQETSPYQTLIQKTRADLLDFVGLKVEDSSLFVMEVSSAREVKWLTSTSINYYPESEIKWIDSKEEELVLFAFNPLDTIGEANFSKLDAEGALLWTSTLEGISRPHHIAWDNVIDQYTIYFFPEEAYPVAEDVVGFRILSGNGEIK